ncbi:tetratricopeptide repeat protein [Phaeospirillum tilakii]|uniref:Tetratricopeptide repeat protein n=1 Tax=Phaeospirillum tilakii TaxID=741673 RepID=A0ABW5CEI0_9PROT
MIAAARALWDTWPDQIPAPGSLPPGSRLSASFAPNPLFGGRDAALAEAAAGLKRGDGMVISPGPLLTGCGGIGKTQLAIELAYRYGQFFAGGVFWLSCDSPEALPAEIASCGAGLDLAPNYAALPLDQQLAQVASRWQDGRPCLVVFDNCEDPGLFRQWRPRHGDVRVIVTSRRRDWPLDLGFAALPLDHLARVDSIALLRRFRPVLTEAEADSIADVLGDLPLALHLAGSYLRRYQTPAAAYCAALERADPLAHHSLKVGEPTPTGHDVDVARTFAVSLDRLDPADPVNALARAILTHASWCAPGEPVPLWLLARALDRDEAGAEEWGEALARLDDAGLIERGEDTLRLHRLIAAFARPLSADTVADRIETAAASVAFQQNKIGLPGPLLAWQVHLRHLADQADRRQSLSAAPLLNNLGVHLRQISDLSGARGASERALRIAEAVYGLNHPHVAACINNLGSVLQDLCDLSGARAAFERALRIDEAFYGPKHPEVARDVNNLGSVLQDLGDLLEARAAYERALQISESVYGLDHPQVAACINNIGACSWGLGDLSGAQAAFERALRLDEAAYGPDHPKVAIRVNNLGGALRRQGDLSGARLAYERALRIDEAIYGLDHPRVATDVNNLGEVLRAQGELLGARAAFERALRIDEAVYGPDHPEVARDVNNLGSVLQDLGDLLEARAAFERALAICIRFLPPDHPHLRIVKSNLAALGLAGQHRED